MTEKKTEVQRGEVDWLEKAAPRHKPRTVLLSPVGPSVLGLLRVSLGVCGP